MLSPGAPSGTRKNRKFNVYYYVKLAVFHYNLEFEFVVYIGFVTIGRVVANAIHQRFEAVKRRVGICSAEIISYIVLVVAEFFCARKGK
jgi:hypothetical protein